MALRLSDIIEACARRCALRDAVSFEAFEEDWQKQWLVERSIAIIFEASHHLPDELKARHPDALWRNVTGIGNVLRHNYEHVERAIFSALVRGRLPHLEEACRNELGENNYAEAN